MYIYRRWRKTKKVFDGDHIVIEDSERQKKLTINFVYISIYIFNKMTSSYNNIT